MSRRKFDIGDTVCIATHRKYKHFVSDISYYFGDGINYQLNNVHPSVRSFYYAKELKMTRMVLIEKINIYLENKRPFKDF